MEMFVFKNWVAFGFFVFGTTFLWMTRDFLADRRAGTGMVWSIVQVLVFAVIAGFAGAAWGVFKGSSWWEDQGKRVEAQVSGSSGFESLLSVAVGLNDLCVLFA